MDQKQVAKVVIKVLAFASIKGGVGKTHIAILAARALAAAGIKVLMIDSDLNNSLSFHYLDEDGMRQTLKLNLAAALSDEKNNLSDYALATNTHGIDLIASSPHLADLRTLSEKRLARMVPMLNGKYDILIIDCHPTYDNIVLNALHAADWVITPVLKDLFSYNAAAYMAEVLPRDVEELENWFVLINGYDKKFDDAKSGRQMEYIDAYKKAGLPLTPRETWLPWTTQIHLLIDYGKKLSCKLGVRGAVYNPPLYKAITELAGCFFDEPLNFPEAF